jgi:AraC-like DNA-binding protein
MAMSVEFSAADLPIAARTDYWRHALGETLGPIEPVGVPDRLRVGAAGAVRVGELSSSTPGGARRTARHARALDRQLCKVDVIADGHGVIEQDGRQAQLGPGDFCVVDLSRPARWAMAPARCVAVLFPAAMLPLPARDVGRLTAVRISGDRGAGALVSSCARQLGGQLDDCGEAEQARLGTAMLDLLSVALASRLGRAAAVPPETQQRALLLRVQAFVEARLGDPELSPGAIAAAHHISLRYLHKLFASREATVAAWIRERRLERCRRDLLDPALRDQPVSAIGARWGLVDAAHFSRAFRAAHGLPPTEYRHQAATSRG